MRLVWGMRGAAFWIGVTVTTLAPELPAQSRASQAAKDARIVGSGTAHWQRDTSDPPGAESVVLREDSKTGALDLLARYPAGHVFAPHWHSANERIVLLEGRLSIEVGQTRTVLDPGSFVYLPARQMQRMSCVSVTRCAFYVYWDGKLDFHTEAAQ